MSTDTNSKDSADTAAKKEETKPAATAKKEEAKPAAKKEEAKPAAKKEEAKPAAKKEEAKPAKAIEHDFDLRYFNASRVAKLKLINPGIVQYDKSYPALKLGPGAEVKVLPLTPFFAQRIGVTIEEVE